MGAVWSLSMMLLAAAPPTFPITLSDEGMAEMEFEALDASVHVSLQDKELVIDRTDAAAPPTRLLATIDGRSFTGAWVALQIDSRWEFDGNIELKPLFEATRFDGSRIGRPLEFGGAAVTLGSALEHWDGGVPLAASSVRIGLVISGTGRLFLRGVWLHRTGPRAQPRDCEPPFPLSQEEESALRDRLDTVLVDPGESAGSAVLGAYLVTHPSMLARVMMWKRRSRWLSAAVEIQQCLHPGRAMPSRTSSSATAID